MHTLMLNTYAACTRRPLTRYHREKNKQTNIHYRRLSAGVRMIYLYYAPVYSLFLHSILLLRQMKRVAELSRTGAPLFDFFDPRCNLYGTIVMDVFLNMKFCFILRLAFDLQKKVLSCRIDVPRHGWPAQAARITCSQFLGACRHSL